MNPNASRHRVGAAADLAAVWLDEMDLSIDALECSETVELQHRARLNGLGALELSVRDGDVEMLA